MLRFIDLRGQVNIYEDGKPLEEKTPHFAFFDTITDRFLEINGSMSWTSFGDFVMDLQLDPEWIMQAERLCGLMPEWARRIEVRRPALLGRIEGWTA